ncbi:porin [Roseibium sp.]|uniref:porin n=1 Tax=Roseibium sp. TaxID=1936156 RepID=UPI003BA86868
MIRSALIGASFGFLSLPALAADLPVAPEPVDYVRICDAYGQRFFVLPGTDTCLRISGRVRADYRVEKFGDVGSNWDDKTDNGIRFRARGYYRLDARTQTEYGLLRAYNSIYFTNTSGSSLDTTIEYAYIQFGGFTFGRVQSFFDFWTGYSFDAQTETYSDTEANLAAYTAAFGNGLSASLSLEAKENRLSALIAPTTVSGAVDGNGGQTFPDLVGSIALDQSWGSAQLMGALRHVRFADPAAKGQLGWAIGAGVEIDGAVLNDGLQFVIQGSYTDGASGYGTTAWESRITDAIFDGTTTKTTKTWNIFGGISQEIADVELVVEAGYHDADALGTDYDFTQWDITTGAIWTPISGVDIGAEVQYRNLDFSASSGLTSGDQYRATFRVQRSF